MSKMNAAQMHAYSVDLKRRANIVVPYAAGGAGEVTPLWRMQAWALEAAHTLGARFTVASGIRDDRILATFNRTYGTHHLGQEFLFSHQHEAGFFPANPPTRTSHAGWQDGSQFYPAIGHRLPNVKWGIDAEDDGSANDASKLVWFLNRAGVHAAKAYPGSAAENHHIVILASNRQCWNALFNMQRKHHDKHWAQQVLREAPR